MRKILLIIALLISGMGLNAQSVGNNVVIDYECYSLKYTVTSVEPAECEVVCYTNPNVETSIAIPSVVIIEEMEFEVTSIGYKAFYRCSNLTSIDIPNSVTSIGGYSFEDCSNLVNVAFEKDSQLTSIGSSAFSWCSNLTSIDIPSSVTSIGYSAFSKCTKLANVTFGKDSQLTSIGNSAFWNCISLTSIEIPSRVTSIRYDAFSACYDLASIVVEDGNAVYDSRDNCNAIIETATNTLIAGCKMTVIPEDVVSIGDYAFYSCSIASLKIPSSVTYIGKKSIYEPYIMESLVCYAENVPETADSTSLDCPKKMKIYVPENSLEAYKSTSPWNKYTIVSLTAKPEVNFTANVKNTNTIELSWDNIYPDSYNIYQNDSLIANVTTNTYLVENLESNTEYCFALSSLHNEIESDKSDEVCAKTYYMTAEEDDIYRENTAMYTTCDMQSNGFISNRMYQSKDGSVAVVTMIASSKNDASFKDRGTGYNIFRDGNIYDMDKASTERLEANATGGDMRTGWPTIAPYGAEGEILVNHSSGLNYWIREKAGEGVWDGPHAIPNPENVDEIVKGKNNVLAWPKIVTTGENNDVLHIFACASGDENIAQYYLRTTDLKTWEIEFSPLEKDDLHINFYSADDYAVSANGDNIAVVYNDRFNVHTMLYESNDAGLTWESRMVWESPIHGLNWETDENSLFEKLYGPAQVSVAIGADGVSHVVLSAALYEHKNLGTSYSLYKGIETDGVAYWNDTTRWNDVLGPIRSTQDDDPKNALRLRWDGKDGKYLMDYTNFCAWMPSYEENGFSDFSSYKQYTGTNNGTAGDYLVSFGIVAYPSIAVDPAGNIAVAYSAPDMSRFTKDDDYYRTLFVSYKAAGSNEWQVGDALYQNEKFEKGECTYVSAVSTPINENEFWFSCMTDDTPGFYSATNASQKQLTTSSVNVFKYKPFGEFYDEPVELSAPINLVAEVKGASSVSLTWNNVENALSYNVYRDDEFVKNTTETNYIDEDLRYNTEYCYTITAVRGNAESDKSDKACAKTFGEGVEEQTSLFNIYPNPVSDRLLIETEMEIQEVVVCTITGVYVEQQATSNGDHSLFVDVSELDGGIYFIRIKTNDEIITKRFVKQ